MVSGLGDTKILILGGSGFLSRTIAEVALAQGRRVWTVTRGQRPLPRGVTALIADRRDEATFARAVREAGTTWDLAIDCIAFTPPDIDQDLAVLRGLARHLVFVSTEFVYDPDHRRFPGDEEAEHYAATGYGGDKRRCELALSAGAPDDLAWTVFRPSHIYGPGSLLGCLPEHGRDRELIARLQSGAPLRLVGGGYFLQQPILARDLAALLLSVQGNARTYGQVFCAAGPEVVESHEYFRLIAEILGVRLTIKETPVRPYLAAHPDAAPFLGHRCFNLAKLRASGAAIPSTPLAVGLREHVASLLSG